MALGFQLGNWAWDLHYFTLDLEINLMRIYYLKLLGISAWDFRLGIFALKQPYGT